MCGGYVNRVTAEPAYVTDQVFAPLDQDHRVERVGGGFETEVYCLEDRHYLVKLKSELGSDLLGALAYARQMRSIAEQFARCLGPDYSIHSDYILSRDTRGRVQVLVVQPFITGAHPLHKIDYDQLTAAERESVTRQLLDIVRRAMKLYRETGYMPDLYGLSSTSNAERLGLASIWKLPWHLWSFLAGRDLLRSWNLLL